METKKMKTLDMVYIALFACLMAICAWISIPGQIPFTLQTMGVFLAVGLLGGKRGTVAVLVYILMGAVGLPAVGQVEDFLSLVENYVYYPTDTLSLDEGTKPQIAVLHCSV